MSYGGVRERGTSGANGLADIPAGGMRQRFGIAVALHGGPSLIIIDEPVTSRPT